MILKSYDVSIGAEHIWFLSEPQKMYQETSSVATRGRKTGNKESSGAQVLAGGAFHTNPEAQLCPI